MAVRRRQTSFRLLGVLCALALGVSLAAGFAGGASGTTAPGYRFKLQVLMTDSGIRFVPHKTKSGKLLATYIQGGGTSARFPRGVLIEFRFTNKGTKTYAPTIRVTDKSESDPLTTTKDLYHGNAVRPGGNVSMFGNFYFRGSFQISKFLDKKPQGKPISFLIY